MKDTKEKKNLELRTKPFPFDKTEERDGIQDEINKKIVELTTNLFDKTEERDGVQDEINKKSVELNKKQSEIAEIAKELEYWVKLNKECQD